MKVAIFSFTDKGGLASELIKAELEKETLNDEVCIATCYKEKDVVGQCFNECEVLIFVCACGIAVRLIAPYVCDKLSDPAVLVCDEKLQFIIPVLSGHVGGANEMSRVLSGIFKSTPVITTATDVNGTIAFDELAVKNDFLVVNRDNIKKVSSGLLKGETVNVAISDDVVITTNEKDIDDEVLGLLFKPVVIGMGCRKGKSFQELEEFFLDTVGMLGVEISHIAGIASIDVKADEPGLIRLSKEYEIPFYTFSAEELNAVEGEFEESEFVMEQVGTSDVSARAAKALGKRGEFILKKEKRDGMTISVFEKYRRLTFNYEKA